jgi:hypothetical protein
MDFSNTPYEVSGPQTTTKEQYITLLMQGDVETLNRCHKQLKKLIRYWLDNGIEFNFNIIDNAAKNLVILDATSEQRREKMYSLHQKTITERTRNYYPDLILCDNNQGDVSLQYK